jgi:hypothetical protein
MIIRKKNTASLEITGCSRARARVRVFVLLLPCFADGVDLCWWQPHIYHLPAP